MKLPEAPAPAPAPADKPDALSEQILAQLGKRGMSSAEIIKATAAKAGDVYYRLDKLRKAGAVVTREDDADAVRKNYLK